MQFCVCGWTSLHVTVEVLAETLSNRGLRSVKSNRSDTVAPGTPPLQKADASG